VRLPLSTAGDPTGAQRSCATARPSRRGACRASRPPGSAESSDQRELPLITLLHADSMSASPLCRSRPTLRGFHDHCCANERTQGGIRASLLKPLRVPTRPQAASTHFRDCVKQDRDLSPPLLACRPPGQNFPRGFWRYSHGLLSGVLCCVQGAYTHPRRCCIDWPPVLLA